jgi:hypothetical protein
MVPSFDSSQPLFVKAFVLQFLEKLWTQHPPYEDALFPGMKLRAQTNMV